jgi:hypothetical protein
MLRGLLREKGVLYCDIVFEVRDAEGRLVRTRKIRSRSFVANFLRILREQMIITGRTGTGYTGYMAFGDAKAIDVNGTARAPISGLCSTSSGTIAFPFFAVDGGAGVVDRGIRVGTGTATPAPTDYALAVPIAHGAGAGQLSHGTTTVEDVSISGSTAIFRIVRTFTNNSGASITVYEVGLFVQVECAGPAIYSFMIARDVISGGIAVPDGSTLTVRYIIQVTT